MVETDTQTDIQTSVNLFKALAHPARLLIVNGFMEPFTKELPLEYAVELNRLIELEMEGSVG